VATRCGEKAKPYLFGTYEAANYDELIDHRVMARSSCDVQGRRRAARHRNNRPASRRHAAAHEGPEDAVRNPDRFFGTPAPMDRYVFLVTA